MYDDLYSDLVSNRILVFLLDNGKKNLVLFNNKKMKIDSTYFYIIGTVLILISGLRKYTIGIDTYAYKVRFDKLRR